MLTRQKLASRCSLPEHIEAFYLASVLVLVVEWLATFNQKRVDEVEKARFDEVEYASNLFSGNPPPVI